MKATYFTQGFVWVKTGKKQVLRGGSPIECKSAEEALSSAERMSHSSYSGVIAALREYDEVASKYGASHILAKYGDILQTEEDC